MSQERISTVVYDHMCLSAWVCGCEWKARVRVFMKEKREIEREREKGQRGEGMLFVVGCNEKNTH